MEFKEYKISELADIRRGASPRPIKDYIVSTGTPWVKIADATADSSRFINFTKEFIKAEGISKSVEVWPGDLILSNSATPGLPKFMNIYACIHDGWLVFRNFTHINKEYMYYILLYHRSRLVSLSNGSVFNNLKTDIVKNYRIMIPNQDYQVKVVNILNNLNFKLELNNSIILKLEQISQTLFKHWFIDFEFPNEEGQPYKSSGGKMVDSELGEIPEGWEVKNLDNIANFQNGLAMQKYRPKGEDFLPVLKIKELNQGFTDTNSDKCDVNIKDSVKIKNGDIVFSWSGTLLVKIWSGGEAGLNQHLFKVTSKDYDSWFYYQWLNYYLKTFKMRAAEKATTMGHIKRSHLSETKVIVPEKQFFENNSSIFEHLFQLILEKSIENKNLEQLRDTLLPKLLSGEIEIPDDLEV